MHWRTLRRARGNWRVREDLDTPPWPAPALAPAGASGRAGTRRPLPRPRRRRRLRPRAHRRTRRAPRCASTSPSVQHVRAVRAACAPLYIEPPPTPRTSSSLPNCTRGALAHSSPSDARARLRRRASDAATAPYAPVAPALCTSALRTGACTPAPSQGHRCPRDRMGGGFRDASASVFAPHAHWARWSTLAYDTSHAEQDHITHVPQLLMYGPKKL